MERKSFVSFSGLQIIAISLTVLSCGLGLAYFGLFWFSGHKNLNPVHISPPTSSSFPSTPFAVWIYQCKSGWNSYQHHHTYLDKNGKTHNADIYLIGNFWIQPKTGELWEFSEKPDISSCLKAVVKEAHEKYHVKVFGVLNIDLDEYTQGDVISYVKNAGIEAHHVALQKIVDIVQRAGYDGVVNDIEVGDMKDPEAFTLFNKNLAALLHLLQKPLGIALGAKTSADVPASLSWQDWSALSAATDFFIIMSLDEASLPDQLPKPISDSVWLEKIYNYANSIPGFLDKSMWELPTYCKVWQKNAVSGEWSRIQEKDNPLFCDAVHTQAHIESLKTLHSPFGKLIEDRSNDTQTPFIHFIDNNGVENYMVFETPASLSNMMKTLQEKTGCLKLSFWDFDTGDRWPDLVNDKMSSICP